MARISSWWRPVPASALTVLLLGAATVPRSAVAQAVRVEPGVEVVSRFIYRGVQLGEAPQVQPSLTLEAGRAAAGIWGSHPLTGDGGDGEGPAYKEAVAWASYTVSVPFGTLTPYVQSHYDVGAGGFLDGASHRVQTQLSWVGPERVPLDLMVGWVVVNDPDHSVYLEGGWSGAIGELGLRLFAGGTPAASPFNGTDRAAFTNVGLSASWLVSLDEDADLVLSIRFVTNPHTGEVYPVVRVGV